MRILITNDDGIDAPGLAVMQEIAAGVAGRDGIVTTVAPVNEQSGCAHSVSFVQPMMLTRRGRNSISVVGTPADCVLVGLHELQSEGPPDLVLSGVNRGNNSGENVLYSGTIGAALEASLHDVKAIALSQYYGPSNVRSMTRSRRRANTVPRSSRPCSRMRHGATHPTGCSTT